LLRYQSEAPVPKHILSPVEGPPDALAYRARFPRNEREESAFDATIYTLRSVQSRSLDKLGMTESQASLVDRWASTLRAAFRSRKSF